ncbi:MAG: aldo/keto reductase [Anaerolineae bacterium]|nr:aldo/keto reductase [Anaerolineae bacterium]
MEYRQLGRTGLRVSALGFGCGSVGGLLVRGDHKDMVEAVARAIESGINYFDTARSYGSGRSETNLGIAVRELGAELLIGTKVDLRTEEMHDIEGSVIASVEGSLKRLGRDRVDLIQLHNPIASQRRPERGWVSVDDAETALQAFEKLKAQGKVGHCGINGLGETPAIHRFIAAGLADTTQTAYNLLNPSAGQRVPRGFPFQDYEQLIDRAVEMQMGTIAIRVLAAGALSGSMARHRTAAQGVGPIGTSASYAEDVVLARRFSFLVDEGYVDSLIEAAIRFVIGNTAVSTTLVGLSNMAQLELAISFANKGPLPAEALDHLNGIWANLATD